MAKQLKFLGGVVKNMNGFLSRVLIRANSEVSDKIAFRLEEANKLGFTILLYNRFVFVLN